jgi:hypothetical protein
MVSLSGQIIRGLKHHLRGRESRDAIKLSKEILKKPFFFKIIYRPIYALNVIETNRHSESTKHSKFALKSISSIFPILCRGLVKRLRVKFSEKPTYLSLRLPLPDDFCRYSFNKVTKKGSYIREPSFYEVDKYFEKAGLGSRMLGLKDLFDKSRGFGKCVAKLNV